MGKIVLKNTGLGGTRVDIVIDGQYISRVVPAGSDPEIGGLKTSKDVEVMDCTGKEVVPGFVNMHTHAAMTLMRGVSEDQTLEKWLDTVWRYEDKIDSNFVHWGTMVACMEMLKSGTTAYNDHYWFPYSSALAAVQSGMRATVSYVVLDRNDPNESARQWDELQQIYEESSTWPGNVDLSAAFHAIYTVSEDMMRRVAFFARAHALNLHIHLAESETENANCKAAHGGLTPVEYLDELGVLGPNVVAAHCLQLSDHDVEILGRNKVNCVHNINSNLKISSGYRFRYNDLRDAGANVCLGTDGCASSNNLDMLETMKTTALLQKAWRNDPTSMPLDELMKCATENGAKALGLKSGVVAEGYLADLMIVDTDNVNFLSPAPFLANFIYSAHSDCIHSVICDGRFVVRNHHCQDEEAIIENARNAMKIIL